MPGIDTYTKLMLHCNGADASTTFTDSEFTPKTVTPAGNAQIDTAQSKFGGASALFDGTGDYLTIPDSADWDFGTADFTIDFWIRFNSIASTQNILGEYATPFVFYAGNNLQLHLMGSLIVDYVWSRSTNTWYHIAAARAGTALNVYIDGVSVGSAVNSTDIQSTVPLPIGADAAGNEPLNGWMDEIRISKGIARWTANFTPETVPYSSTSAKTVNGLAYGSVKTYNGIGVDSLKLIKGI